MSRTRSEPGSGVGGQNEDSAIIAQALPDLSALTKPGAEGDPALDLALQKADQLRQADQPEVAIALLRETVARWPDSPTAWGRLAVALYKTNQHEASIQPYFRWLDLQDNPVVRGALVAALFKCGQLEQARIQRELCLEAWDRAAVKIRAAPEFAAYRLKEGGRGFDPENRARNIISFSLWGDRPEYVTGAIVNAQISRYVYPGWTARFYCDPNVPADAREALRFYGAQTIVMKRPEDAQIRMMWRFLASDDPNINVFLVRDTDSRLNAQELLAVQDWLKSGKRFHTMRDHLLHSGPMMGGMWGGYAGVLPNLKDWIHASTDYYGERFVDQFFLWDKLWPLVRDDVRAHDSLGTFHGSVPFPEGFRLPADHHIGGGVKTMPHWSQYYARSAPGRGASAPEPPAPQPEPQA